MIGDVIRKLRTQAGMTLEELAEKAGLSAAQISRFENGARQPKIDQISDLANALGVTVGRLFDNGSKIPVMGYVGAGAQVEPEFEQVPEGGLETITLPFTVPSDIIAFQVRGDSMMPRYDDGDYILVFRNPRRPMDTFVNEEALVLTTDGRRYVKVIDRTGDRIDLRSWNSRPIVDVDLEWVGQIYMRVPAGIFRIN